jgi:ABC-type antimicrobial peptide transport system permease subunit
MEMLVHDLRYAGRTLLKAPSVSILIVISIALGVAANVTVFSIANGLLWGVLPIEDPGRMVMFSEGRSFSYPDYLDYSAQTQNVFEGGIVAHFPIIPASIGGKGEPERVWGQAVSGNYFSTLGNAIALGSPILPEDDQVAAENHLVVLSDKLWRRRFGTDANVLNREIALNGKRYTVIGIAPPGFYGADRGICRNTLINRY